MNRDNKAKACNHCKINRVFTLALIFLLSSLITILLIVFLGELIYQHFYEPPLFEFILNVLLIISIFSALVSAVVFVVAFIFVLKYKTYYKSIKYRKRCYKKVEKIHIYLEKGIINEENFQKIKKEILKHIEPEYLHDNYRADLSGECKTIKNISRNNIGMRWFDFFYKFSIPIGMVLSVIYCLSALSEMTDVPDNIIYIVNFTLQLIYFVFAVSIFVNYRRSNTKGNIGYSAMLYYLTIAFVIYISAANLFLNFYSAVIFIPYTVLNIIYFSKRKELFDI